jgi:hypothetical protein
MRLERIILALTAFLVAAGYVVWAWGGVDKLRSIGLWLWFGALGVSSLPLLGWLVHRVMRRNRD